MGLRSNAARWAGRVALLGSRWLGQGGTSLPGRVAEAVDPDFLRDQSWRPRHGVVVVSGTNGKTTTARMLGAILREGGLSLLQNVAGANLRGGIVTAVLAERRRADLGIFEVDEAAVSSLASELRPRLFLALNVFRDQLDRYGEVTHTAHLLKKGLHGLADGGSAVVNADDPLLASWGRSEKDIVFFGMGIEGKGETGEATDIRACPFCGNELQYRQRHFAHLGDYRCPVCGWTRPKPDYTLVGYRSRGSDGADLSVATPAGEVTFRLPLPGLYNAYNALAAVAAAGVLGAPKEAAAALERFQPAFGRMERIRLSDGEAILALVKNPTGFNQVLRIVEEDPGPKNLLIVINDRAADGTDVSWLWDVDFERLFAEGRPDRVFVSGTRAADMAVRLKYAGFPEEAIGMGGLPEALRQGRQGLPPQGLLYILPTYTALLEIRRYLAGRGLVRPFWQVGG